MKKKLIAILCLIVLLAGLISGCGQMQNEEDKTNIVCTVFPVYDWIQEITAGEQARFSVSLLSGGGDLHSFQPSARDIAEIHTCDLLVTVGGITDKWTDEIKASDNTKSLRLFDLLEDDEKLVSGEIMGENHTHEGHGDDEYDEHVWLSLKLAERMVNAICEKLCDIDPQRGVVYQKNALEYCTRLKELDKRYTDVCQKADDKTVVFADRFPFAYLMHDYQINCCAAFPGCSSDANASFQTAARLLESVKEHNKHVVLVLENSNQDIAQVINNAFDGKTVRKEVMDSCQSITESNAEESDYIEIMEKNLRSLEKALM